MNIYLLIILSILLIDYWLDLAIDYLTLRHVQPELPEEFHGYYDLDKYRRSQEYLKANTYFGVISNTFFTVFTIVFILAGGFSWVDRLARSFHFAPLVTGLIFAAILLLVFQLLEIPFSLYDTFVIEEKYGFNKTTAKTFVQDILKGWFLTALLGGLAFALMISFFGALGKGAWLYVWLALTVLQLFITFIAPVTILPLFNKFIPLEAGPLRDAIETYAAAQEFKIQGIYTMDGSRRSTKSNAFFTGFGRYRRIVLFDTLIAKHTVPELVAVLAHEVGHFKKKHILRQTALSILVSGVTFYLLSWFINNPGLFAAFRVEELSIYASLFFFGFLFAPINLVLSVCGKYLSRRYEYEADAYAVATYRNAEAMISALKKLSVDNLSNLTPHPFKVALYYTHPPVLERIKAIRKLEEKL